jgi:hypothetical protein
MSQMVPPETDEPPVNLNLIRHESWGNTGVLMDSRDRVGLPLFDLLQLTAINVVRIDATNSEGIRKEPRPTFSWVSNSLMLGFMKLIWYIQTYLILVKRA